MMSIKVIVFLLTVFLISVTIYCEEDDLLDEYVKYVESNHQQPKAVPKRFQTVKKIQNRRFKRDLDIESNDVLPPVQNQSDFETQWTHQEYLDTKRKFLVKWFRKENEIIFRIEAETRGYIGFGFSPNGNMKNADMILAWFDNEMNQPVIWDCHGSPDSNTAPIRDEIENYNLLRGEQIDSKTIIEFSRLLDTCDEFDYVLNTDTVRLIWAMHDTDPQLGVPLMYHGPTMRGTRSVHLLTPKPIKPPSSHDLQVRKWEVTLNNFVVPGDMDTLYWCKIFKTPTLQEMHHIIGYEPIIGTNHTEHAHHMVFYECELGRIPNLREWEMYTRSSGAACYGPFMPRAWEVCLTPVVAWAVGSKGEFLPEHVGLPLAEKPNTFYMLEVHFDNPNMKRSVGTTGLKVHYTRRLRRHNAGIMVSGVAVSPIHVIPPKQPEYKTAGLCSSDCTNAVFPERGINIVSVVLHSHLAGKRLSLRHIRNGEELPKIVEDNNYDFDFQQSRTLKKERVVFPGDTLITECVYQTKKRTRPTVGGYSTKQEMCLAFVLHYPRTQLAGCYSMAPIKQFFDIFGVQEFYSNDMKRVEEIFLGTGADTVVATQKPHPQHHQQPFTLPSSLPPGDEMSYEANQRQIQALQQAKWYTIEGDTSALDGPFGQLVIKEPEEFQNKTFMSHLSEIPWDEPLLTKRIEESFYKGQHLTFCRKRDYTLALPETVLNFPKFIKYEDNSTKTKCPSAFLYHNDASSTINTSIIPKIIFLLIISNIIFIA